MSQDDVKAAIEVIERAVERANSKQPAFTGEPGGEMLNFASIMRWAENTPPPYEPDTRKLDVWLREFVKREPFLNGVLGQVVSLVRNRGWNLSGGRNSVIRTKNMIHDSDRPDGAPRGRGYRHKISRMARAFYGANIGAVEELGRDTPPRMQGGIEVAGPLRAMWSTDPTLFKLRTGTSQKYPVSEYPLAYYPQRGRKQYWRHSDFLHVVDNPSTDDRMAGAGYCAVAICRELAEIMVGVWQHDKEMLGARAPRGLLLLQNVTPDMWNKAMQARREKMEGEGWQYYAQVAVLASASIEQVDAKLVALSSLPANFDQRAMIDVLMYLYALVFKYPPDEFWPVAGGAFGRNAEAFLGVERATKKGDMDFFASYQEQLQHELPATVQLEYEDRDDRGRELEARIHNIYAEIAAKLASSGVASRPEARSLLVEPGELFPGEWTELEEDVTANDMDVVRLQQLKERLMDTSEHVRRALAHQEHVVLRGRTQRPSDYDVVRYSWPSERLQVLWPASDAPHYRSLHTISKQRATLYDDGDVVITDEDVDAAFEDGNGRLGEEFLELLEAQPLEE